MLRNNEKSRFHTDGPRKALRPELPHCRPVGFEKTVVSIHFTSRLGSLMTVMSPDWLAVIDPAPCASSCALLPPMVKGVPENAEKIPFTCQSLTAHPTMPLLSRIQGNS